MHYTLFNNFWIDLISTIIESNCSRVTQSKTQLEFELTKFETSSNNLIGLTSGVQVSSSKAGKLMEPY